MCCARITQPAAPFSGDGIPSIASFDESDNLSEFSNENKVKAKKLFDDIRDYTERDNQTMETESEFSSPPDGSTALHDSFGSSGSLVPSEPNPELNEFETNLRHMIEEAQELENQNIEYHHQSPEELRERVSNLFHIRGRKSPSVQSNTESVVSVIEAPMRGKCKKKQRI